MPIEQDLLPSEEFHRAVMAAAQEFYNKTGVRAVGIQMQWSETLGSGDSVVAIGVKLES